MQLVRVFTSKHAFQPLFTVTRMDLKTFLMKGGKNGS